MTSRSTQLLAHLDTHRAALLDTLRSIPTSLHHRKPSADGWSVAEVVEHLAIVEPRMVRLLASRIPEAPRRSDEQAAQQDDVTSRLDHAQVVDRRRPVKGGEAVQPKGSMSVEAALASLATSREELRALIAGTEGVDLASVSHPHPALGPLDLEQWILFVGSHEARHTAQIREAVSLLNG